MKCTENTRAGRPCKANAVFWPSSLGPDPGRCRPHLPDDLRAPYEAHAIVQAADLAEIGRRAEAHFHNAEPACWSWPIPETPPADEKHLRWLTDWQDERCAICGLHAKSMVTDHDHATGLVRGLLCISCNLKEGHAADRLFQRYRERHPTSMLGLRLVYQHPIFGTARPADPPPELDGSAGYALGSLLAP